jgi:hypothetical protein
MYTVACEMLLVVLAHRLVGDPGLSAAGGDGVDNASAAVAAAQGRTMRLRSALARLHSAGVNVAFPPSVRHILRVVAHAAYVGEALSPSELSRRYAALTAAAVTSLASAILYGNAGAGVGVAGDDDSAEIDDFDVENDDVDTMPNTIASWAFLAQ